MAAITEKIIHAVDTGPVHEIRETYLIASKFENEKMKLETRQRKLENDQKHLNSMKLKIHDRIDEVKRDYVPILSH